MSHPLVVRHDDKHLKSEEEAKTDTSTGKRTLFLTQEEGTRS